MPTAAFSSAVSAPSLTVRAGGLTCTNLNLRDGVFIRSQKIGTIYPFCLGILRISNGRITNNATVDSPYCTLNSFPSAYRRVGTGIYEVDLNTPYNMPKPIRVDCFCTLEYNTSGWNKYTIQQQRINYITMRFVLSDAGNNNRVDHNFWVTIIGYFG